MYAIRTYKKGINLHVYFKKKVNLFTSLQGILQIKNIYKFEQIINYTSSKKFLEIYLYNYFSY